MPRDKVENPHILLAATASDSVELPTLPLLGTMNPEPEH